MLDIRLALVLLGPEMPLKGAGKVGGSQGILMGREGVSADVAFQRMRSAARSSRRPVAEVAQIVVDGGPWGLPRKDA